MALPFALLAAVQDPQATRVILDRTWLDMVATIGQSLVSLLVLILLVTATFALLALRRALDELTRLVRSTSSDITGAVHDARLVVEELRTLSGSVRGTADIVRAGVRGAKGVAGLMRRERGDRSEVRERRREREEREGRSEESEGGQGMAEVNREERMRRRKRRRRGADRPRPSGSTEREGLPDEGAE